MSRLYICAVFSASFLLSITVWAENSAHVQQALDTGNCPGCDLSQADLSGLNAMQGDFSSAALQGAILYGADLRDANFAAADLSGADLTAANLQFSDLAGANLAGVITNERTTCIDGSPGPCTF